MGGGLWGVGLKGGGGGGGGLEMGESGQRVVRGFLKGKGGGGG